MFLNSLYTVQSIVVNADILTATIELNPAHELYNGHFPNNPVTPGVVQLQILKEVISLQLNRELAMKTMRTCKFLQILNPNETPVIHIQAKLSWSDVLEVVTSISYDETVYLKAQVSYSF
jgi:3-hydroxyacyl-[acyl-carrier-protein] dehydratase